MDVPEIHHGMSNIYLVPSSSAENLLGLSTLFQPIRIRVIWIPHCNFFCSLSSNYFFIGSSFFFLWINLCFFSMDDLRTLIFTFRGRLFRWFFVLLLLAFYSSTQGGKRHFPLFENRILTNLGVEINLVDFHIRGIGPGCASIVSV